MSQLQQEMIMEDGSRITLIHFTFLSPQGLVKSEGQPLSDHTQVSTWKIACVPNLTEMHANDQRPWPWRRSDDPRAVTCPNCKRTQPYKEKATQLQALGMM